jgi:hypothetical protein
MKTHTRDVIGHSSISKNEQWATSRFQDWYFGHCYRTDHRFPKSTGGFECEQFYNNVTPRYVLINFKSERDYTPNKYSGAMFQAPEK